MQTHCRGAARSHSAPPASGWHLAQSLFDRQQPPQMHQLQQAQLKVEALLLPIPKLVKRPQHHLQKPRQLFFAEQRSRPRRTPLLIGRDLQQLTAHPIGCFALRLTARRSSRSSALRRYRTHCRASCAASCPHPAAGSPPSSPRPTGCHPPPRASAQTPHSAPCPSARESAPHPAVAARAHPSSSRRRRDRLVHDRQRVAHRAIAGLGQQRQRALIRHHAFCCAIARSCPRMSTSFTAWKLKCWHRDRTVCGMSSGCVVAIMKTMWSGGSSSVFSSALNAASVIWCASSRM